MKIKLFSLIMLTLSFLSCKSSLEATKTNNQSMKKNISALSSIIVYKTTKDYSDYVPVTMNEAKTMILSYPAPSDLFYQDKLAKPTQLKNGYLLDNRGINKNVVFLNFTYEEYSKFKEAPTLDEMYKRIIDKYPLTEMIYCGPRNQYTNLEKELNTLIDGEFQGCKKESIVPMSVTLE